MSDTLLTKIHDLIITKFPNSSEVEIRMNDIGMETTAKYKTGFEDYGMERTLAGDIVATNIVEVEEDEE
jgi:hypothetical protein